MVSLVEQMNKIGIEIVLVGFVIVTSLVMNGIVVKNKLMELFGLKSDKVLRFERLEKKTNDLEESLSSLEEKIDRKYNDIEKRQEEYHEQSIAIRNKLSDRFDSFEDKLDKFIVSEKKRTVANFRSTLWRMHKDFVEQGYVTPEGLKAFLELGEIYEEAGGNDIYHDKLKPEVEALEIRYHEGGIL